MMRSSISAAVQFGVILLPVVCGFGCSDSAPIASPTTVTAPSLEPPLPSDDPFGTCSPTGSGMASGVTSIVENYNPGGNASYGTSTASCWRTFQSSLNPLQAGDYGTTFESATFGGIPANLRKLSISGRGGIESHAGVDYSPFATPNTGWNSGQFGYLIDLHRNRNCHGDVSVTAKLKTRSPSNAALYGVVVNGTVKGSGSSRKITGYFIHANGGGRTMTLAMYRDAYDRAFDFVDQFPGAFGNPNPLTDGPYKGWDFAIGPFAAGGDPMGDAEIQIASRYRYDRATSTTVLEWEMRPGNGTDATPGSWDFSRTLTGTDSLPPAGGYGVYALYYGGASGPASTNDVSVSEFRMSCTNP